MLMLRILVLTFALLCAGQSFGQGKSGNNAGKGVGQGDDAPGRGQESADSGPNGGGNAGGKDPTTSGPMVPLTADQALEAVRRRQAAPLAALMERIQQQWGGEIVDVSLLRVGGSLVYAVKVLGANNELSVQYYSARSGDYIRSE